MPLAAPPPPRLAAPAHSSWLRRLLLHPHLRSAHGLVHLLVRVLEALLLPLGLLAGVAAAAALVLVLRRQRAGARWRGSLVGLRLLLPREPAEPQALERLLQTLHALRPPWWRRLAGERAWLALELERAPGEPTVPRLVVPARALALARSALRAALPAAELVEETAPPVVVPAGVARGELRQRRGQLAPLAQTASPLLGELLAALEAEQGTALVQIAFCPEGERWLGRAFAEAARLEQGRRRSLAATLAAAPLTLLEEALSALGSLLDSGSSTGSRSRVQTAAPPDPYATERARALRERARRGGVAFACAVRFACRSSQPAATKAWAHALQAPFRTLEGPWNGLSPARVRPWRRRRFDRALAQRTPGGMLLTACELALLLTPARLDHLAELELAGARKQPPPLDLPDEGRLLALAGHPGRERQVRLARETLRTHLHVFGPPGSGKTSTCLRLALATVNDGDGAGVFEEKGDLARAFLLALPASAYRRLCLIDLAERDLLVGLNPLELAAGGDPERAADDTLSVFKRRFHRYWGPQTDDLFKGGLRTLLRKPGATLLELPLLLSDPGFRARYLEGLDDPVALGPFWQRYEQLSPAAQAQAVGPVLNKLRDFLFRSQLRAMLGQEHSSLSFTRLLQGRALLVVNTPKGGGREAAELIGAFALAKLWQAALARSELPERERTDFVCFLDEFQNLLHAEDFAEILAEARALRLPLVLAHQTLAQLPERDQALLLNLVRSSLWFQPGHEDAARLARALSPRYSRDDLLRLGPYEAILRLARHGAITEPFSCRTLPPPAFDPAPWTRACKRDLDTLPLPEQERSPLLAAPEPGWQRLAPAAQDERLRKLAQHLLQTGASVPLQERVALLDALPDPLDARYQQIAAGLREAERERLLRLDRVAVERRILATALARARSRRGLNPAETGEDEKRRLLAGQSEDEWASAVEEERLARLRRISALRYGRPAEEVERALRRRLGGAAPAPTDRSDGVERLAEERS